MLQTTVFALIAQRWANLVESCCPEVACAEWHVGLDEIAIRTWFAPHDDRQASVTHMVDIVVSSETLDDYLDASDVGQFRADAKLIEFVTHEHMHPSGAESASPEQWSVSNDDLALKSRRTPRPRFWTGLTH